MDGRHPIGLAYQKAQTKGVAWRAQQQLPRRHRRGDGAAQMVRGHQAHRGARHNASAVELTAIQHGLAKPQIVARGAHRTCATRVIARRLAHIDQFHCRTGGGVFGKGLGQSGQVGRTHRKPGVFHLQGLEYPRLQKLAQALACDGFDDATLHIHRQAVFPHRAGLLGQWRFAQAVHHLGAAGGAGIEVDAGLVNAGLGVSVFHQGVFGQFTIGQP